MRSITLTILLMLLAQACFAQGNPRIKLTQLEQAKTVESSKAGQIPLSNSSGDLRFAQYVEIDLVPIGFVPTATGNTSNYSEFVTASDGTKWYIDWQGRGYQFPSGAGPDKNGYYGGNGGNGGDATIPSSTTSTITNQFTFYKPGTTDFDDLTPLRVEIDGGNESPFMAFVENNDSMLVKRSDTEFSFVSEYGIFIQSYQGNVGLNAAGIVNLNGDSIIAQTVPNAVAGEKTFLMHSPNNTIVKKEGIALTDLNFDPYQVISASGAGPTEFNIELSDGGGFVTLQEGANVDLTRLGDVITISSTGGGGGGQTLSVASNTTTLSGGGGSMTIAGAGINVATTSGSTITITGTEVDGLTTNEGSLTVGAGTGTTSIINSNTSGSTGVTLTAGTGLSISEVGNVITLTNTSPDVPQTLSVASNTTTLSGGGGSMTIAGAGINVATTSGSTITITGTEVDGLTTNEGSLTVGAGTGTTSIINSNTSGSTGVTLTAGTGLSISEVGNVITLTNTSPDVPQTLSVASNTTTLSGGGGSMTIAGAGINVATTSGSTITITGTEVDGLTTNEGSLTVGAGTGTTSIINSNTSGSTGVTLTAGTGLSISEVGNVITLTNTSPDVPQTLSVASNTTTLSGGGSMTIAGAGINVATTSGSTITITGTEVDGLTTNEGSLTVGAGTGTTSIINSNTSGSTGVTLTAGTGLSISEVGNVITLTSTVSDTKNGYYGGNGGNGGDATIPSSTTSTITNQFTFYKPGTTDFDDLTPLRVVVDAGNESPFMAFVQGSDSMLVKKSDTEFALVSERGIFVQSAANIGLNSGGVVNITGDSMLIQTVPNAVTGENTFLMLAPSGAIVKKEGAGATTITDYTSSGTFTVPSGAKSITVVCVGGGGGGGSGRKRAVGAQGGGGAGGSAGAVTIGSFSIAQLGNPASITVTVGTGGPGGAAVTANTTTGNNGTSGGETSCSISGTKFIVAGGGFAGGGGGTVGGTAGALQDIGDFASKQAGGGGNHVPTPPTSSNNKCAGSGGGGGGISNAEAISAGAAGGSGYHGLCAAGTGGASGGGTGNPGTAPTLDQYTGGGGGGGGSATSGGSAGAGGAGARGGGGGGGGAGTNSAADSGAGGAGGNGWVRIICNF